METESVKQVMIALNEIEIQSMKGNNYVYKFQRIT